MKRKAEQDILTWAQQEDRKPLVLRGARQVGKTYLVRWLAKHHFQQFIEVNFEKKSEYSKLFESNEIDEVINALEIEFNQSIKPGETLIFLDEIQTFPAILAKLRWWAEDSRHIHVVCAGSLLDFALNDFEFSMPVGRIQFMYLEPFSFFEFLDGIEEIKILSYAEKLPLNSKMKEGIHEKLLALFRTYLVVGGMPEAIMRYKKTKKISSVGEIHAGLIETYRDDFNRYKKRIPFERINKIFNSLQLQLGKKFVYSRVDPEEKNLAVRNGLDLLLLARVAFKVQSSYCNGVPLHGQLDEKNFKVFFVDVGLVNYMSGISLNDLAAVNEITQVNSGAIAEQFVAQMLRYQKPFYQDPSTHYWVREKSGSDAEVDFVIQKGLEIVPIEVKAGPAGKLRSLQIFTQEKKSPLAIRLCSLPIQISFLKAEAHSCKLITIPIYLAERLNQLIADF